MDIIIHPKLPDWQDRLDAVVARSHGRPFAWGEHDCALHAADVVFAQTGMDFAGEMRGHYDSMESGLALLQAAGFADHAALAASVLPEIPPAFAQVGDIAGVDFGEHGLTLMVVGGHHLVGPMPRGAGSLPLTAACRAFAVGRSGDID